MMQTQNPYYLVDDEYHILQFSEALLKYSPEMRLGDVCYQVLHGQCEPCAACPMFNTRGSSVFRSRRNGWVQVDAVRIEWPQIGPCNMLLPKAAEEDRAVLEAMDPKTREIINHVTGLYTETMFLRTAASKIKTIQGNWVIMVSDIEHFKLFNQWFGAEEGDRFLRTYADTLMSLVHEYDAVAGYFGNDDFALLLPGSPETVEDAEKRLTACVRQFSEDVGFAPTFGIFPITDRTVPICTMYDCALEAMRTVKNNYMNRVGWYDTAKVHQAEADHVLLSEVQHGLENNEFCVYVQPQVNMLTGKVVGCEALVRWRHPTRGIVSPGEFIPLLERNGFITKLDAYIWNHVAKGLRLALDMGRQPIPISVNVSRMDLYSIDVVGFFQNLLKTYDLPPRLLEVEITETAYMRDADRMAETIDGLHRLGLTILMDDFGSGYSSLNMLREIPVDIIKLDMKFLQMSQGTRRRGVGILESIVNMAHMLGISLIAEGVETAEQKRLLLEMNCQYAQGYYFYRPMPVSEMQKIIGNPELLDLRGIRGHAFQRLDIHALLKERDSGGTMLNNVVGALVLYRLHGDTVTIEQVNDNYFCVTATDMGEVEQLRKDATINIPEEERGAFLAAMRQACQEPSRGAELDFRRMGADGQWRYLHLRVFFLRNQDGDDILYGVIDRNRTMPCPPPQPVQPLPAVEETRPASAPGDAPDWFTELRDCLPMDLIMFTFDEPGATPRVQVLATGLHGNSKSEGNQKMRNMLQSGQYKNYIGQQLRDALVEQMTRAVKEMKDFTTCLHVENDPNGPQDVHLSLRVREHANGQRVALCSCTRCPGGCLETHQG